MKINPLNVIKLLLAVFQTLTIEDSPINHKERALAEKIESILKDSINEFYDVEMVTEDSLDFQEPYKDVEAQIVEDQILHTLPEPPYSPTNQCTNDQEELSFDYKSKAVEYWRSGKNKNLGLSSVQNKFRKVTSIKQLKRWAHTLNKGGTYREKIARICKFTLENFKTAIDAGLIVHDLDLRKWALQAQKELGPEDFRFAASKHWLNRFKRAHRIVSRKINKFVTRKTLESAVDLERQANQFVTDVKECVSEIGVQNMYNSDQSGFQLEMHSGRTLAVEGEKQVQCVVQSVSSTTHSYTIQPLISGDGKLLSPLFVVLKEQSGQFGPIVEANLFRPENVYVRASKSGKLTSDHFKDWIENVFFPNVGQNTILLLDSWSGHCPKIVEEATPSNKIINIKKIPSGTTGKIQPLDVFGFRIWKNFVRHFSDNVILMNYDMNLHLRNNIIKMQSLVHNQLSSPRYTNLWKYSWYKSGYINEKPEYFDNPVDFSFGDTSKTHCEIEGCTNIAIIRCGWCKKNLCFKHFFEEYHYCSKFEQ